MFKSIAVIVVVALVAVLVLAGFQPDRFRVERTTSIQAPPEKIAGLITDFHRWPSWSPYEKLDPDMKRTIGGAPSGRGAVYEWEGDAKAGKGRMEITQASPSLVAIKLDFIKPFPAHNIARFRLEPRGAATQVTWSMDGPTPFVGKVIHLFVDMDRMVGSDFETGLANLKSVAEG